MKGIGMNITIRPALKGQHEAIVELSWYGLDKSYSVRTTGIGGSPEDAEKLARLMLGQARSQLIEVTAKEPA